MNVSRSIKLAMVDKEWLKKDLAEQLGVSAQTVSTLLRSQSCSATILNKLADVFGMKTSEFIALGE